LQTYKDTIDGRIGQLIDRIDKRSE
jgi:hypothetical protein